MTLTIVIERVVIIKQMIRQYDLHEVAYLDWRLQDKFNQCMLPAPPNSVYFEYSIQFSLINCGPSKHLSIPFPLKAYTFFEIFNSRPFNQSAQAHALLTFMPAGRSDWLCIITIGTMSFGTKLCTSVPAKFLFIARTRTVSL